MKHQHHRKLRFAEVLFVGTEMRSNHSVKRTAPGVPGSAAYLKRQAARVAGVRQPKLDVACNIGLTE